MFDAAIRNKVKKIVITSSIASVFTGITNKNNFNEKDWSNIVRFLVVLFGVLFGILRKVKDLREHIFIV